MAAVGAALHSTQHTLPPLRPPRPLPPRSWPAPRPATPTSSFSLGTTSSTKPAARASPGLSMAAFCSRRSAAPWPTSRAISRAHILGTEMPRATSFRPADGVAAGGRGVVVAGQAGMQAGHCCKPSAALLRALVMQLAVAQAPQRCFPALSLRGSRSTWRGRSPRQGRRLIGRQDEGGRRHEGSHTMRTDAALFSHHTVVAAHAEAAAAGGAGTCQDEGRREAA